MIFLMLAKVARARRLAGDFARRALGAARDAREIVPLRAAHALSVDRQPDRDLISLVAEDGSLRLRISISDRGPEILVEAASVSLRTTGDLAIEAERLQLRGRQALALSTGDGARVEMDGSVRIRGERIYLNS